MILALLVACSNLPATNEPPRLFSVNDAVFEHFLGGYGMSGSAGTVEPGTDLEIEMVFEDPEGQHVRVWWPAAPEGFEFDPDGTTGVWHVPLDLGAVTGEFEVLLEDTADEPAIASYWVPMDMQYLWDTGYIGTEGSPGR